MSPTESRNVADDVRTLTALKEKLRLGDIDRRGFLTSAAALSTTALLAGCGEAAGRLDGAWAKL